MTQSGPEANVPDGCVQVTIRDRVAWIVLNRPEALNAINNDIRASLPAALERIQRDDDVRVIVIRGAGSRAFSVGADIKEFGGEVSPIKSRHRMVYNSYVDTLEKTSKPIIAAISGFCLGGGLELALTCDIRIASADASFGLPEVNLGLIPGAGGTQRLPQMIGLGVAMDLLLTGRRIDATEALRLGLVSRLAATPEALLQEVEQIARTIADKPPMAAAFVKEAARKGSSLGMEAGLRLEKDLFSLLLTTKDRVEAALAFQQKRAPRFTGE